MSKKIYIPLIITILALVILISLFFANTRKEFSKKNLVFGTLVKITIYAKDVPNDLFVSIFDNLKNIENKMSVNIDSSEIYNLNTRAGEKLYTKLSDETFSVIEQGIEYSKLSDGRFDITIGPLVKLWGIGTDNAKIPTKTEINKTLDLIDYNNVDINKDEKSVRLKKINMSIDLGGIAKGYAADMVANHLKDKGYDSAIINIGGNIYALGKKSFNKDFTIAIQNPKDKRGTYIGTITAADKSIVTSGIYERFFEKDNVRYHHILDTTTGFPVDNKLAGVTIVSNTSIDGDALSTSVFSMGLDKGLKFVQSLDNIEAILVTKDNKIYLSNGIKNNFQLKDPNFKIVKK